MKDEILILMDLEANVTGFLNYAFELAKTLQKDITLLNCYPKAAYNRRFNFKDAEYSSGIIRTLKEEVKKTVKSNLLNKVRVKYRAAEGSQVDHIKKISENFELLIIRTQIFKNSINKFLSSNISFLTEASYCPIMILPPDIKFKPFQKSWLIERNKQDFEIINKTVKLLQIEENAIEIKHPGQKAYKSNLWKTLNSVVNFNSKETSSLVNADILKEHVDLIFLTSFSQQGFKSYLHVDLTRRIFQLGIPILIVHKNK